MKSLTTTGIVEITEAESTYTMKKSYVSFRELKNLTIDIRQDPLLPRVETGYDRFIKVALFTIGAS